MESQTYKHSERDRHRPGLSGIWEESLHLPGNRQNRARDEVEINDWTRLAKAFYAEEEPVQRQEAMRRHRAAPFKGKILFLLPAWDNAVSTFKLFKDLTPSYHWWERKAQKKRQSLPGARTGSSNSCLGHLPHPMCSQPSPGHLITQSSLTGNAIFSWTGSTALFSWQVNSTESDIRDRRKSDAQETSTTQRNKCLLNTHKHQNLTLTSLPPGSFPWLLPQVKCLPFVFPELQYYVTENLSHFTIITH